MQSNSLFSYKYYSSLPSDQPPLRKHRLASIYTFNNVFSLNYINSKPINSTAGHHTKKIKQILFGKQNSCLLSLNRKDVQAANKY